MARSPDVPEFRPPDTTHRPATGAPEPAGRYAAAGNLPYYPPEEHIPAHPGAARALGTAGHPDR
jgi:hypothetical protein